MNKNAEKGDVKMKCFCCKKNSISHGLQLVSCSSVVTRSKKSFTKKCERKYELKKCCWRQFFDWSLSIMPYLTIIAIAIAAIFLLRDVEPRQNVTSALNIYVDKK